jgi:membrane protease YdiL (CAAX protease family)
VNVAYGPERPATPRGGLLARYPLTFYFLITFAFSWLLLMPIALSEVGAGLLPFEPPQWAGLLAIASLLGPVLAGFVMTAITEGREGIRRLLHRIVLWRVGFRWYLFAIFGLPLVMLLGTIIIRPGALESFQPIALLPYLSAFVFMVLIGGPLFEEPGWSGFALPRLQRLHGPLAGGLILGSLWALWHLPGYLIPSQDPTDIPPRGTVMDFVVFALALVGLRLVMVWVFNSTRGSVLLAILVHASWNTFYSAALIQLFPAPSVLGSYLNLTIAAGTLALVVVVLTRGRLGYQRYRREEDPDPAAAPT